MLIVSQDKERVVSIGESTNILFIDCYMDEYSIFIRSSCLDSGELHLAGYDTEKRVKGVLRELTDAYRNGARVFCMPEE